ncbi:YcbK family protein [Limnobacter parvus]|uniref:D-Ala-D-Ala carboxypeptidase family metallohydrolase n=1 Tax=Limnobacter parvus TaxID=2939690 RepID=A0ABT1XJY4_9BURK|nr:D-Ala-D-Ala carboxypeptidase family metallohydrolase [Limnobacter parvus]MCR2747612.1 D-Ala-D-Ala carboxypeptidase family metallohydrolase [Limnobacter parvus]
MHKVGAKSDFGLRRKLLAAFCTGALLPKLSWAGAPASSPLLLDLQRDGQRVRVNVLTPEGYRAAAWMLRDIKAGNVIGWPSLTLLVWAAQLQEALNTHHAYTVFAVTSGLRTQQTNRRIEGAAQHSLHLPDANNQFHAMDFKPLGATLDQLELIATQMPAGGVGRYSSHLHLDVRNSPARW